MSECEQTKSQSVLEHGISVKNYLFDLINHLRSNTPLQYEWKLPDWVLENKDLLLSSLPDDETLELYTVYHDCGKPFCLEIDENGKRHFPNHAEVSYQIFNQVFNNSVAAELILHDMDIHLLKSDGVVQFCQNLHALTLLLTGLAELHSNAQMFGGLDSTSFKIKWKCINQRGKQIINQLKNKN
jgi:uncharacterized protein YlaN (UPF0358 family)